MRFPIRRIFQTKKDLASRIFDEAYYRSTCGDHFKDGEGLSHFIEVGSKNQLSPSPLFDPTWVSFAVSAPQLETIELLKIYEKKWRDINPHPLFSVSAYLRIVPTLVASNPIEDYLRRSQAKKQWIPTTHWFDGNFYLRCNPDVKKHGVDPFLHYLRYGWKERRQPSPYFSSRWYLSKYGDVAAAGIEPLRHFVTAGFSERRQPHYLIDLDYYLSGSPDVVAAGVNPLIHYAQHGDHEGRSAHPLFDPTFYRANGPSIGNAPPFAHYAEFGRVSGRSPCPGFDSVHYAKMYPNEAEEPFLHFMLAGAADRRHTHPLFDGDYQMLTSSGAANGTRPLVDYLQFRSCFAVSDRVRGAASVPQPTRARATWPPRRWERDRPAPSVSIVVPCYKSNPTEFGECVRSIQSQTYPNWKLILIDDGSPDTTTWPGIRSLGENDPRIVTQRLAKNAGISAATNAGMAVADGDYVAFVDHDDVLMPDALTIMIAAMQDAGADAAYSDQVFVSANGVMEDPSFKPDWSPALFAGVMYVGHLLVVRRSVAVATGGFLSQFDGCQDFEFMLRVSELTDKIIHVPKVLYGWRRSATSVASNSNAKGRIEIKQAKAVNAHFARTGFHGSAECEPRVPHRMRIRPTKSKRASIQIDVVVSAAINSSTISAAVSTAGVRAASVTKVDWTKSPADGVARGRAPWILFAATEVKVVNKRWLDYLLMYAECADVAFVAPHIYEPSGRVRSAGLVAGRTGVLAAYCGAHDGDDGTMGSLICDREVSAVGADFALVSRTKLETLGGLGEIFAGPEWAVVDSSFRASQKGLRNISVATRLVEVASAAVSRDLYMALDEEHFMERHRAHLLEGDPYYNSNFAPHSANFIPG
jgi:glycosyltransferase involved in cell wall biosynthesis